MPHFETQGIAVAPGNFACLLQTGNILSKFEENRKGRNILNFDIISSLLNKVLQML